MLSHQGKSSGADSPESLEDARSSRRMVRRAGSVALGAMLAALAVASVAQAAMSPIMSSGQGLSAGNAKSSDERSYGIYAVDGSADHTWCPALAQNYVGYTSQPRSGDNRTAISTDCGPGYKVWYPNGSEGVLFRGAAFNPNQSTFDTFSFARFNFR